MKKSNFKFPIFLIILFYALSIPLKTSAAGGSIYLDHINNYQPGYVPSWVEAGKPLVFNLGVSNNTGGPVLILRGFFEIYSTNGATWQPIDETWSTALNWNSLFDGGVVASEYDANGSGADTANFISLNILGPGFPNNTSAVAWIISTQVETSQIGKQICIDSVRNSRGTAWLWSTGTGNITPSWGGPYCFAVEADCCQGIRGDANGDGFDSNALDLSFLVDRVFRGGPPPACALEADLNGDGASANIGDLTYLIDFIYRGGPPGVACP